MEGSESCFGHPAATSNFPATLNCFIRYSALLASARFSNTVAATMRAADSSA